MITEALVAIVCDVMFALPLGVPLWRFTSIWCGIRHGFGTFYKYFATAVVTVTTP